MKLSRQLLTAEGDVEQSASEFGFGKKKNANQPHARIIINKNNITHICFISYVIL